MKNFHKPFNFDLKFVFKAFFSDQAFWDFLDAYSTFSAVCIKKIG
jgi:hypothetical protein